MNKYLVEVEGKNFLLKGEEERMGFFTGRCVEAADEEEAIQKALTLIREEYKDQVEREPDINPAMVISNVIPLESFGDADVPGAGAVWYPMKDGE